jgi:Pyruvate/2-oxoacid:ferredoxin oxidoreductase delta subunit
MDMSTTNSRRRIDANTEEFTQISKHQRTMSSCVQCDMFCHITDIPSKNRTIRSGHERCYGCEWANDSLHKPEHKGETFEAFCLRKEYTT